MYLLTAQIGRRRIHSLTTIVDLFAITYNTLDDSLAFVRATLLVLLILAAMCRVSNQRHILWIGWSNIDISNMNYKFKVLKKMN
jgi:hypothetical protein